MGERMSKPIVQHYGIGDGEYANVTCKFDGGGEAVGNSTGSNGSTGSKRITLHSESFVFHLHSFHIECWKPAGRTNGYDAQLVCDDVPLRAEILVRHDCSGDKFVRYQDGVPMLLVKERHVFDSKPVDVKFSLLVEPRSKFNLQQAVLEQAHTEVTLDLGFRSIAANKELLTGHSRVFRKMLESSMKESKTGVIKIPDFSHAAVKGLIDFMHTNQLVVTDPSIALETLAMAHHYEVTSLLSPLERRLCNEIKVENFAQFLSFAKMYNMEYLMQAALQFFVSKRAAVMARPEFQTLLIAENCDVIMAMLKK